MSRSARFRFVYTGLVLLALAAATYQSVWKGWLSFVMVPVLFFLVPSILVMHIKLQTQLLERRASSRALPAGILQLVSLMVFYWCTPGIGDTEVVYMFGFKEMLSDDPFVGAMGIAAVIGLLLFIVTSGMLLRYLIKGRLRTY